MREGKDYWFPAKRFGRGWGPPVKWQGWLVVAVYFATVLYIVFRFGPQRDPVAFVTLLISTTLGLVIVCWWKGEPPKWRWGEKDKER